MLRLDRVHTEILRFNAAGPPSSSKELDEQTEIYDYRIQKLVENALVQGLFPPHVSPAPPLEIQLVMTSMLQLRANQVRMYAYTHYLSSSSDGPSARDQATEALLSIAVSSVDVFLGMPSASPLWMPLRDRLLMGSVSCMFLAASQNPSRYGPLCHKAFHTAINCLKQSSYELTQSESEVWCSLDDLQRLAAKIEMPLLDESPPTETSAAGCFDSITLFGSDMNVSAEELAQICENTSQDSMSGLWDVPSLWAEDFTEFELV